MSSELAKEPHLPSQLQDFPPRLRKIAKFLLNSNRIITLEDAIMELNLNKKSIYNGISDSKKKGNDFYEFLNQSFQNMLSRSKFEVGKALVRGAVSDSHMDRKLFFQLSGDLRESTNVNINVLTIGYNINPLPAGNEREKGEICVQPFIPKGK